MKRFVLLILIIAALLLVWTACQKTKPKENIQASVYLFFASHLEGDNITPLFPGETSIQTIQAVLQDAEEITGELQKTFGYTRVQLEGFQKFLLQNVPENQQYFFRLGKYFVRVMPLKNGHQQQLPVRLALFSPEHMNLSTRLTAREQLFQAALLAPDALPLLRVRITIPIGESVILGKAIAPGGEKAFFVVMQLQSIGDDVAKDFWQREMQSVLIYRDVKELQKLIKKNRPLKQLDVSDTIPNVKPFHALTVKPFVVKRVMPEYPESLRRRGIEGRVIVKVLIDEQGKVIRTQILKGSPYVELNEAAVEAAKQFEFEPGKAKDKPVKVWMTIPFSFRLKK